MLPRRRARLQRDGSMLFGLQVKLQSDFAMLPGLFCRGVFLMTRQESRFWDKSGGVLAGSKDSRHCLKVCV